MKSPTEREQVEELLKEIQREFDTTKADLRIIVEPTLPILTDNGIELIFGKPDLLVLKDGALLIIEFKAWKGEILANLECWEPWAIKSDKGTDIPYGERQKPPHKQILDYNEQLRAYIRRKFGQSYLAGTPSDMGVSVSAWIVTSRDSVITEVTEREENVKGFFRTIRFDMFPANELSRKLRYQGDGSKRGLEVFEDVVSSNRPAIVTDLKYLFTEIKEYEGEVQCEIPGLEKLFEGTEEEMEKGMQIAREFNLQIYANAVFQVWKRAKYIQNRRTAMVTLINWNWDEVAIDSMLEESLSSGKDILIDLSLEYFIVRGGEPKFLEYLTKLLDVREWKDRDKVLEAIVHINSPRIPAVLISRYRPMGSPSLLEMAAAVEKDRIGYPIFRDKTKEEKEIEKKHYQHKEFFHLWLKSCPECRMECRREIYEQRKQTSLSIIKVLGKSNTNESLEFLRGLLESLIGSIKGLGSSEQEKRRWSESDSLIMSLAETVLRSLVELRDAKAGPIVMDLIDAVEEDDKKRFIEVYCDLAGKESFDILLGYARSDDDWISSKAVKAIAELNAQTAFDGLFAILTEMGTLSKKEWLPRELIKALTLLDPKEFEKRCLSQFKKDDVSTGWKAFILFDGFYAVASKDSIEPLFQMMNEKDLREECVNILTNLYKIYPREVEDGIRRYLNTRSRKDEIDSIYIRSDYYESHPELFFDHELEFPEEVLRFIFYTYMKSNRSNRVRKFLTGTSETARLKAWEALDNRDTWKGHWKVYSIEEGAGEVEMMIIDDTILLKQGSSVEEISHNELRECRVMRLESVNIALVIKYRKNGLEHRKFFSSDHIHGDSRYEEITGILGTVPNVDPSEDHLLDWYIWNSQLFGPKSKPWNGWFDIPPHEWYFKYTSCRLREPECNYEVFDQIS